MFLFQTFAVQSLGSLSQEVWRRFPELRDEMWHFVITFPGGIYVFIL